MYRLSKALGSLSVRSTIQLCHRQPSSLSSSSSEAAAAAAAARWVTTKNRKSYDNLGQCGDHGKSNSHNTSIVVNQIRLFSGQTDGSKKETKKRRKKKKKKVEKYGHQWMIAQHRKWDKLELKRLKNLSHQAKLNEILARCHKHFKLQLVGSDEYNMEYTLDYDLRQEFIQSKGWVRVQSVLSHPEFKHWCNADLFMEALASQDGLDQCDVIYNRKVVETVELNKNRQYWQKLKRKQLKIEQVKKSKDYIRKVRLEWFQDNEKKYIDTELDQLKKEIIRLALTNLPVDAEISLTITLITRQRKLEGDRNMIHSLTSLDGYVEYYEQNDDETMEHNKEFERCLNEYMLNIEYDIHLTKKEKKDVQRLNRCERIDEELEELPSEIINDDISSSDLNYALMRYPRVTKEYLDILRDIDEYEDDDDLS